VCSVLWMMEQAGRPVLAENTHPFQNPSLRMDNPFGLLGLTG